MYNSNVRDTYSQYPLRFMIRAAKTRAKKAGMEFDLSEEDLVLPSVCPILGIPLEVGKGGHTGSSPSLDRIDNSKGYVKGNVWVISRKANTMKSSASFDDLLKFAHWATTSFGLHGSYGGAL